ncbi:zinc uptake protein ZrgA [Vibrio mangrovi]|uniref:DUF2796 domain-containing protein n=1 Tax=Vibrio mangrovi TaxID=474394 RepID=A0A1Y6IXE5_9VIBR|nr:DUF2796 domain-containing protein [Vibrio mangrovi]MDW6002826.1 DUF2796 domain-containing protein [Vibrio mangrovi]SMS02317.1 hypothetical protein VIM7927_03637 [Vibrio mangrovi]
MLKIHNLAILAGLITAASAHAEENFRQHEAHVHGVVEMNIAQDANELLVEITSPGMDIVGFEHPPQTPQEHQALDQAMELLEQADNLITINTQAGCKLEHSDVHQTSHHHEDEHDHDAAHHHDHDEAAHDSEHHHDHDEDAHEDEHHHDGDEHEHGTHNAFSIQYRYTCRDSENLNHLSTQWFNHFPHTHEIHTNVFTDRQQTAIKLNPHQTDVSL